MKLAIRSLAHAKGLSVTVVLTLALGIGANAAIFSVVRSVLLRPLVNRDDGRLIYLRQSARGIGTENTTFSVPEIDDLRARVKTLSSIGGFSTITFTMVGLGEPRAVRTGVVDGDYFDVMGLRPVLGRLLTASDHGPNAAGAAVLTYRFWMTTLNGDTAVIGKSVRLGTRSATIVGVLEPSVPYPADTEVIANVVTSPHHLSAMMVTGREHRMTELFGRLAPATDLETMRAELRAVHTSIVREHPEAYSSRADFRIEAVRLRDQITSPARTVLLLLLTASALIFVIACSNVANLMLARTVRREPELTIRVALGASAWTLRKALLAESLLLCTSGATLGVLIARPMVTMLGRYASRLSLRALDLTIDSSALWVGVLLAIVAAVLLAFVPRLRAFVVTQIAGSFLLLAGAGVLAKTLLALHALPTGFETRHVLALNVPVMTYGRTPDQTLAFYTEITQRLKRLPGIDAVAIGTVVPWRDAGTIPEFQFTSDGYLRSAGEDDPRARMRTVSPGFFATLGIPLVAGRDFTEGDRRDGEKVVIVSSSLANRMFSNRAPLNRHVHWTDPVMKFIGVTTEPMRIVGIAADVDDEHVGHGPVLTVYQPFQQGLGGGRVFVRAHTDPYALVPSITRVIREMSPEQPVERAATLEDVRGEVLAPDRLNTLVFGGFAGVALAISMVGVAGVLAFSVSGRTREFGIRLAIGSPPRRLLMGVLLEGLAMTGLGVIAGAGGGYALARLVGQYVQDIRLPGLAPVVGAAAILLAAALVGSVVPAARAARVDLMTAIRSE